MTTAADIWLCGAIGLACGSGNYPLAALIFAFTLIILTLVRLLEKRPHNPETDGDFED
jgi:putative Mg2+ transporter-C (MgtC) family protein